jgi:RNA polymerase sigma-70 factor (ECF subfamily)
MRDQSGASQIPARPEPSKQSAFEELFRANYEALCRFAFRFLRDRAAAEDVVQEVFGHLWMAQGSVVIRTSQRAYLYAAVRNRSLNICKHDAVVQAWQLENAGEPSVAPDAPPPADDALDLQLVASRLAEAFDRLPPRQAEAMRLRWHDEMSHAEIAEALGVSVKGVEKHLSRGLAALRRELAPLR